MSQLSWMITITDRKKAPDFVALYQQQNIHVSLTTVGAGTAVSETLNYLGLERTEKAVIFTTVTDSRWKAVKRQPTGAIYKRRCSQPFWILIRCIQIWSTTTCWFSLWS